MAASSRATRAIPMAASTTSPTTSSPTGSASTRSTIEPFAASSTPRPSSGPARTRRSPANAGRGWRSSSLASTPSPRTRWWRSKAIFGLFPATPTAIGWGTSSPRPSGEARLSSNESSPTRAPRSRSTAVAAGATPRPTSPTASWWRWAPLPSSTPTMSSTFRTSTIFTSPLLTSTMGERRPSKKSGPVSTRTTSTASPTT